MAGNLGKWPSKRGPLTKIGSSDVCTGDAGPLAVDQWYYFSEFGGYLGNVGLVHSNRVAAFPYRHAN